MTAKVFLDTNLWVYFYTATAILDNCSIVYSEDMQHSQLIDRAVQIINPFQ